MISHEDFIWLSSDEGRGMVNVHLADDPVRIALNKKIPQAHLVASQVKYLQRARAKLPSYYAARCIIPSLAFEQSSNEACAALKEYSGKLCIDLTCGLGVDAYFLSKKFEKVITVEQNPMLAELARYNFKLLGAYNIEVICASSEEFIRNFGGTADMIYADPDRRDDNNRKLFLLEDCSPNMVAMMPELNKIAPKVVIKSSPLFDVDRPRILFGQNTLVEVVSLSDECKEVIIEIGEHISHPVIRATAAGMGSVTFDAERLPVYPLCASLAASASSVWPASSTLSFSTERYCYLIVPDVSLKKGRVAVDYFTEKGIYIESNNGYGFADTMPTDILGRVFTIASIKPFNPKELKKEFKERGIKRVEVMHREFPLSTTQITTQLGIREGGDDCFVFTTLEKQLFAIELVLNRDEKRAEKG